MSTHPKAGPSVADGHSGYYAMIACALNAFGVEPTPGEPLLPV